MKKLLFFISALHILFAKDIVGLADGNIVIKLNNKLMYLKNNDKVKLKFNDTVCYVKGDGSFVIDSQNIVIDSDFNECYTIKAPKKTTILETVKNFILIAFNGTDTEIDGATVRATKVEVDLKNQKLSLDFKKLPVVAKIYTDKIYEININKQKSILNLKKFKHINKIEFYYKNKLILLLVQI